MKRALMESTIIQGTVTLVLVATVAYMSIKGIAIPELLNNSLMAIIGFWFGSKTGVEVAKRRYRNGRE